MVTYAPVFVVPRTSIMPSSAGQSENSFGSTSTDRCRKQNALVKQNDFFCVDWHDVEARRAFFRWRPGAERSSLLSQVLGVGVVRGMGQQTCKLRQHSVVHQEGMPEEFHTSGVVWVRSQDLSDPSPPPVVQHGADVNRLGSVFLMGAAPSEESYF